MFTLFKQELDKDYQYVRFDGKNVAHDNSPKKTAKIRLDVKTCKGAMSWRSYKNEVSISNQNDLVQKQAHSRLKTNSKLQTDLCKNKLSTY